MPAGYCSRPPVRCNGCHPRTPRPQQPHGWAWTSKPPPRPCN
jgi:hypothetical protein